MLREVPKGAHKLYGKWQQHWFTANWQGVSLLRILAQAALWCTLCCVERLSHVDAVSQCALGRYFWIIYDPNTVNLIRMWARETRIWYKELIVVNQLQNVACFISLRYFLICLISTSSFCFLFLFRWGFVLFFCLVVSFPFDRYLLLLHLLLGDETYLYWIRPCLIHC